MRRTSSGSAPLIWRPITKLRRQSARRPVLLHCLFVRRPASASALIECPQSIQVDNLRALSRTGCTNRRRPGQNDRALSCRKLDLLNTRALLSFFLYLSPPPLPPASSAGQAGGSPFEDGPAVLWGKRPHGSASAHMSLWRHLQGRWSACIQSSKIVFHGSIWSLLDFQCQTRPHDSLSQLHGRNPQPTGSAHFSFQAKISCCFALSDRLLF